MKPMPNPFAFITVVACLALVACVSSTPVPTASPQVESMLSAAGFKTVTATTPQQLDHLSRLTPGQVSVVSQTGKDFFVYPDKDKSRIYVGTEKEYQAYQKLRAQSNLPTFSVESVSQKQDKQMSLADQQDASVTWGFWPGFSGLGWQ